MLLFLFLCSFDAVALVKAIDASCCIDKLLFAGKERVACRADFNVDILHCRTCFDDVTANAGNLRQLVLWMNVFSHRKTPIVLPDSVESPVSTTCKNPYF